MEDHWMYYHSCGGECYALPIIIFTVVFVFVFYIAVTCVIDDAHGRCVGVGDGDISKSWWWRSLVCGSVVVLNSVVR